MLSTPTSTTDAVILSPACTSGAILARGAVDAYRRFGVRRLLLPDADGAGRTLALVRGSVVPVIHSEPPKDELTGDADRIAMELGAAPPDRSDVGVVICPEGHAFQWPAAVFAGFFRRRLRPASDLREAIRDELRRGPRSVTLFAPVASLDPVTLSSLWPPDAPGETLAGVVTGRNENEVWAWLVRRTFAENLYQDHRKLFALGGETWGETHHPDDAVVTEGAMTAGDIARLTHSVWDTVALQFHSKESCGLLGPGLFCGLPDHDLRLGPGEIAALPGCVRTGACIWGDRPRVRMAAIRAAHLCVISCSSLRFALHLADLRCSLGLAAFAGSIRSMISPIRFTFSIPILPMLMYEILHCGTHTGRVAADLNRVMHHFRIDRSPYVLLGDPEDLVMAERALRRKDVFTQLDFSGALDEKPMTSTGGDIHSAPSDFIDEQRRIVIARDNLRVHEEAGFFPIRLDELPVAETAGNTTAGPNARDELCTKMVQIARKWAEEDCKHSYWLTQKYGLMRGYFHRWQSTGVCRVCKEICQVYSRGIPGEWLRFVEICARCGLISDLPDVGFEANLIAPPTALSGSSFEATLVIRTKSASSMIAASISVSHAWQFGWHDLPTVFADPITSCPTRRFVTTLSVPPSTPALIYHLRAYVMVDCTPGFLTQPLVVRVQSLDARGNSQ